MQNDSVNEISLAWHGFIRLFYYSLLKPLERNLMAWDQIIPLCDRYESYSSEHMTAFYNVP